jgi:hypothetical protein
MKMPQSCTFALSAMAGVEIAFVCSISRVSALSVRQRRAASATAMTSLTIPTAVECRRLAGIGHRTCGLFYPSNQLFQWLAPPSRSMTVQRLREVFETFDTGIIPSSRRVNALLQRAKCCEASWAYGESIVGILAAYRLYPTNVVGAFGSPYG